MCGCESYHHNFSLNKIKIEGSQEDDSKGFKKRIFVHCLITSNELKHLKAANHLKFLCVCFKKKKKVEFDLNIKWNFHNKIKKK